MDKYKIEIFSASMLPPAKRQRVRDIWHELLLFMGKEGLRDSMGWGVAKAVFVFCVYYIYWHTTLLMYGIVKRKQTSFAWSNCIHIYLLCRHEHDVCKLSIRQQ